MASTRQTSASPPSVGSSAVAWGENYYGQLGALFRDNWESSPVPVEGVSSIRAIAASESFNLALLTDGTLLSWGGNNKGQLGDDRRRANWEEGLAHVAVREENPVTHVAEGALHDVEAVAAANQHAVALMADGTVRTWGNDTYGQLGIGIHGFERIINTNVRLPKLVPGLTNIKAVAAGGGADYAITAAGTVLAWGSNTEGQLGIGEAGPEHCETETAHYPHYELCSSRPLPVLWQNPATGRQEELKEVTAVAAGQYTAYALLRGGRVVSWGGNHKGQLGTGAQTWSASEFAPAEVTRADGTPLTGVAELAAGWDAVLARLRNGEVLGWGGSAQGTLTGVGSENCAREATGSRTHQLRPCAKRPLRIPALEALHPEALSAGHHYGLALSGGAVYAWGENERAQLGSGQPHKLFGPTGKKLREAGNPTPTLVQGVGQAVAIAAGATHSVALLAPHVAPPPALIAVTPAPLSVNVSWRPETSTGREPVLAERLLYRPSERAGEPEPAEQGRSESEEGPPVNLTENPVHLAIAGEPLEGQRILEGQTLAAEPGAWSGGRPITFTYQWQRCAPAGEPCVDIAGALHWRYVPGAADLGSTLRALVTATGPEAQSTVPAAPTEVVEASTEGEGRVLPTSVTLPDGSTSFDIRETIQRIPQGRRAPLQVPAPLEAIPYEVKLRASGRTRVMVLTPLP